MLDCQRPLFAWWTSTSEALCPAVPLSVSPRCCSCLRVSDRLMATGAIQSLTFSWTSAGSRPTTTMLTSRELHQEVGSRGAGPVASTEGKLAHLAATSMTAALAQDCMHHWVPFSSLHLQLWST